jgi:transcriptional regulator with XRE-family HTH domain
VADPAARAGSRRSELAQFLRSRRARITPADVGLPPGLRRRTPGLRREEVAQLAGVGVTWYTWLEQGRPINASVQILDAIARTLRLDQAEREHLYRLADVPSVPDGPPGGCLAPEVQSVLDALVPLPAAVYNGRYDLLAYNRSYYALFPILVEAPPAERNALWQMFMVPACCCAVANKDVELPQMVATFRAAFARHLGEPAWTGFVRRLSAASPDFARMWATHDVAGPSTRLKLFQHVLGRLLKTVSTSFAISMTPEARMIVYTPVDDGDRELLGELLDQPLTEVGCPLHRKSVGRTASRR